MKKIFLFATMAVAATLASCSKNTEIETPEVIHPDGPQVRLTLAGENAATRFFFNPNAMAETWEKDLRSLSIYVFDGTGKFVLRRNVTPYEMPTRAATFALPNSAVGKNYSFYVVANAEYGEVASIAEIEALTESLTLDEYNGAFDVISRGRKRDAGFVMTGVTTAQIDPDGSPTEVPVIVRRTVAKIAMRVEMHHSFAEAFGKGTVTLTSVKLSRASAASNSFHRPGIYAPRTTLYETTQAPVKSGPYHDALFYTYENPALAEGNRVMLTLTGVFDGDGNDATTGDRLDVEYKIELTGAADGEIKRNGYYMVKATIKGLSGDAVGVNIAVSNWETPVQQIVTIGN